MATTIQYLNLLSTPNQRQRVVLDDQEYVVKFRWRERTEGWYISVYDPEDETPIVEGRRLRRGVTATKGVEQLDGVFLALGEDFPDWRDAENFEVFYAHES